MMKGKEFLILCLLLAGCSMAVENNSNPKPYLKKKNLTNVDRVRLGMTIPEVKSLMADKVIVGYQKSDKSPNGLEPIVLKNPTKAELLKIDGRSYDVFYYFIRVQKADGLISDDEMVPMVFDNNHLVGMTWDYLFKLRNKMAH